MVEPISIDLVSLNLTSLAPMLVAVVGALIILCIDLINRNLHKSFYVMLTVLFLILS